MDIQISFSDLKELGWMFSIFGLVLGLLFIIFVGMVWPIDTLLEKALCVFWGGGLVINFVNSLAFFIAYFWKKNRTMIVDGNGRRPR
jgi:hypothetical protein